MSSFKHKINNKRKKQQESIALKELVDLKKQMKEQFDAGKYVDAMDTMAEIAEHKKMDPEIMFMGATCYFMTGDTERATKWINNTLAYDPQNVGARILLGRICFTENKEEEGFEVLNFVVDNQQGAMSEKNKEQLMEILKYCNDNMSEDMEKYPSLVEYFKANGGENMPTLLAQVPAGEAAGNGGASKAKAAVDRLKELLHKSKGQKADKQPLQEKTKVNEPANEAIPTTVPEVKIAQTTAVKEGAESATEFMNKVMSSNISLREKIQSLNNYASGLYLNDDYDGALKLLKTALEIDNRDPFVLRNIAYVCVAMKDKEKALAFAKTLPMMDFGLLKAIKGHCHE
ncbi:tetratricopeptide repeat protein [uncultured Anaerovibrio sp.]|uniref:tetratricopeptide repeat protein n=1 Tax=uncultured Anaerovibrio sp. TaxID=361586 RepID=UPI0026106743|nr:tetratricopeptide repeat protein [uncultured Anaerovibrio sp.]